MEQDLVLSGWLPDLGYENLDILTFDNQVGWSRIVDVVKNNP